MNINIVGGHIIRLDLQEKSLDYIGDCGVVIVTEENCRQIASILWIRC